MNEEGKTKIEDVKRGLYDSNNKSVGHQREGILHSVNYNVAEDWSDSKASIENDNNMSNTYKKPPVSPFKKFFLISVIFFIGALGFAYYKFSSNDSSVSSDKISINIIGNSFTKGGDELPLQIEITNNNSSNLELANLIVEYPKGADDEVGDVVRMPRDAVGTIKPGENVIRNIKVKLYGVEKSVRNIKVSLEYHPQGSNAIFTKDKIYPVTISLAPLALNIDAPTNTTSNQEISFKVTATLNTSLPGENPILQITYPNNFVFDSATPAPISSNSIWDLSSLTVTNPISIEVKGRLIGQDGDEQVFHVYAGTSNGTDQSKVNVVYSSMLQKIAITKPFLDARILVNNLDQTEYAVEGGEKVDVSVAWANNLPTRITDGQIIVSLAGNVFDKNTVIPNNGFYDSSNNQIIWDKSSNSELSEINPGQNGTVTFSFKPTSLIGLSNSIKEPQVSINVGIKGREPLLGSTYNDINNFSSKIVKILSDFQIASSVAYAIGSNPPKAETETSYKVTWTLSNTSNSISNAEARSSLPIYVKWVGLTAGEDQNITYNEVTREVIWNIGSVQPGTGISNNREASFNISLKPSVTQVGSVPQLMKEINLSGTDTFTNTTVKSIQGPVSTSQAPGSNGGRVIQ